MKNQTEEIQMINIGEEETEIDLLELGGFYLSRWKVILAAFLAAAIAAGCITWFLITPLYTATSKIYMVSASSESVVDLSDLNIGTSLSQDYEELMKIRPLMEDVIEELKLDYTYDELLDMVSISVVGETRIVQVSVTSPDPEEAKNIANSITDEAVSYLPELMETSAPNVAEYAITPEKKSSPSLTKNTLIGALLGLVVALGVLTVLYMMDDTLNSSEEVEKFLGVTPLTVIPEGEIAGFSREKEEKKKQRKKWRRKK